MAQPAAVLSVLVSANTGPATRGLMRFNTQLGATEAKSNKALAAVKTLAKGAALGAGVGLGYAVKKAADFEQQLDSLGSVSEATGRQMEQFRRQAMKAGADTKFSALDAAKAQTELAKGGLSVRNIMRGGLASALALAAAGEMDLADAAATTANAMNLFGLKGKDSIKVADALAQAANDTTADVKDFAMALTQGGGVAKTAGLSFQQTVLALEALAKAGTKNSDAGTSLKTSIIQLLKPSEKQAELAKKLGLNFVDSAGNMKKMADVSVMLRDKLGGMTRAQRVAALATLAGTDGVRTLTALYDAGPQKLDKWEKGLTKSGTAAEVAARKQDNLKGKLENLQGSVETIAIAIGSKLLPSLTKAATKITDILNDPKLTASEKLSKFSKMFGDAIASAGPQVAKAAGVVGLAAVQGFFSGFHASPLWFKLLTAGFLISKLGGFKAFRQIGMQGGAMVATGMAEGAAGGAMAGRFGRAKGAFRTVGRNVLGVALLAGVADAITAPDLNLRQRVQQAFSTLSLGVIKAPVSAKVAAETTHNIQTVMASLDKLDSNLQSMRVNGADNMRALAATTRANMKIVADTVWLHSSQAVGAIRESFNTAARVIAKAMSTGKVSVKDGMSAIEQQVAIHSRGSKDAAAAWFGRMRDVIAQTMSRGGKLTEQGMKVIRKLVLDQLALYGLSPSKALANLNKVPRLKPLIKPGPSGGGGVPHRKQTGGMVVGGTGSGDKVPFQAMVEPGERIFVLNRNASRHLGQLQQLNTAVPRFAQGGSIPGLSVQGANSPLRSVVQAGLDKVGGKANSMLANAAAQAVMGGGGSSTTGLIGQVKRAIRWARAHGWTGQVNSGFRSRAEQAILYARYLAGGNLAAKPGTSEHEKGRAIDVSDYQGFLRAMQSAPANARLKWFGPGDSVHFSVSGHQKGGLLKGFQKGGLVGGFDSTSYGPPWGGIQGTGTTATGVDLHGSPHRHGIAVDPSVLNLGKKYWAWPNPFGYKGPFKAFDTGGAIKGNRVDFYDWRGRAAQLGWGRRGVQIFNSDPWKGARKGPGGADFSKDKNPGLKGIQRLTPAERKAHIPVHGRSGLSLGDAITRQEGIVEKVTGGDLRNDVSSRMKLIGLHQVRVRKIRARLRKINRELKRKLKPGTRQRLLAERGTLLGDLNSERSTVRTLGGEVRDIGNVFEGVGADTGTGGGADTSAADAAAAALLDLTQQRIDIDRELLAQQKRNEYLITTQGAQMLIAATSLFSQGIGRSAALGRRTPAAAGRVAAL